MTERAEDTAQTSQDGPEHYAGYLCRECTNDVGWVGRHEQLCSVHWLKAKILGVFGIDWP